MSNGTKFSPELRERAVGMVQEGRSQYPSLWKTVAAIAPKIGCTPTTLLNWVKRAEIDSGQRPGVSTAEVRAWADSLSSELPLPRPTS